MEIKAQLNRVGNQENKKHRFIAVLMQYITEKSLFYL